MVFVAGNPSPDSSRSLGMTVMQRSHQGRGRVTLTPALSPSRERGLCGGGGVLVEGQGIVRGIDEHLVAFGELA